LFLCIHWNTPKQAVLWACRKGLERVSGPCFREQQRQVGQRTAPSASMTLSSGTRTHLRWMGRSGTSESQISSIEALSTQSSARWPSKELYHTVLLRASGAGFKSRGEIDSIEPSRRLAQGPAKFYFSCNRFNSCWCLGSSIRSIVSRVTVLSARIELRLCHANCLD